MNFYLMMTLFLEIMKCQFLSEPVNEKVVFPASVSVTVGSLGALNTQSPPVQGTDQAVDARAGWLWACVSGIRKHHTVPEEPGPPALTPYPPGQFSTWGCWTNTSRQGILNMTSFGKTFWSLWAKMFLKYFPVPRTQTGVLCAEVCVTPWAEVRLAFRDEMTPQSPRRPSELPEGFSLLLHLPNGLIHFCWIFLACFPNAIYFFSLIEKVCMYLFQYMENIEVYRRK